MWLPLIVLGLVRALVTTPITTRCTLVCSAGREELPERRRAGRPRKKKVEYPAANSVIRVTKPVVAPKKARRTPKRRSSPVQRDPQESLGGVEQLLTKALLSREEEVRLAELAQARQAIEAEAAQFEREEERPPTDAELAVLCGYASVGALRAARRDGVEAREQLILANMRLVVKMARSAFRRTQQTKSSFGIDRDGGQTSLSDLVGEGVFGLATAVDRFDPSRGFKLSTYATWWIRSAIADAVQKRSIIRIPVRIEQMAKRARNVTEALENELGRRPSSAEFAAATGLTQHQIKILRRSPPTSIAYSLDVPILKTSSPSRTTSSDSAVYIKSAGAPADSSLGDIIESPDLVPEHAVAFHELRDILDDVMAKTLKPTERDVLRLRLGLDDGAVRTRTEVGAIAGHSVKMIRNLERSALQKLRKDRAKLEGLEATAEMFTG
ncbi:hypothetical protein CTAYLR_001053 [Chrysophaeum taylorii]|uniref:Uncharacterized protein n=1 Tax=Chrysophaeum taylorii TaxID=2483200 RepID=A0AAD7XQ89_9STRA|nr:hypothetical protein CTAYLR_001053 [Chrysophaeum taylorii]